nr:hypothetical protein [Pseudonocardia kunmingensis]
MTQADVVDIEQDLILALLVPDLPPRVARVDDDRSHGRLRPRDAATMGVASGVSGRR